MTAEPPTADRQWIRAAVSRFEGRLILYAARILGDVDAARDVVQETFLRLCGQDRDRVEPHLAEWLFTVCRNRAVDVRRKEARMSTLSDSQAQACRSPDPQPGEIVERNDSHSHVMRTIEGLPDNQQEVLRLKFQNGLSYREISGVTGLSESNVGFLLHTGLKNVRQRLAAARPSAAQS